MKRTVALLMAALMICAMLAGCGEKKAENDPGVITMDVYKGGLCYAEAVMQQNYGIAFRDYLGMEMGDGTTGADFIKKSADELFREFESVKLIAADKGIKLTAEDKKQMKENKKQMIESLGGEEAFKTQMEASGMNEAFYDYVSNAQMIFSKINAELFMGDGEYAMTAEEIVAAAEKGKYVRVKHVLIQGVESDEDFADKKALAAEVAAKAAAGEDFEALIKEYGEDPGMESYPHGYIIDQNGSTLTGGSMVQSFTDASIALAVDGVSAPVQSDYGFHIIKRYPIDVASVNENYDLFAGEFAQPRINEVLTEYLEKVEPKYPKGYENIDLYELFGVEENAAPEADANDGIEVGTAEPANPETEAPTVEVTPAE